MVFTISNLDVLNYIHKIINLPPPSFIYYPKYRLTGFHLYKLADFPKLSIVSFAVQSLFQSR